MAMYSPKSFLRTRGATNMNDQTIMQIVNKPSIEPDQLTKIHEHACNDANNPSSTEFPALC